MSDFSKSPEPPPPTHLKIVQRTLILNDPELLSSFFLQIILTPKSVDAEYRMRIAALDMSC